jgi:hypothetical protein
MDIDKEEFEVLWRVEHSWENNPSYAADDTLGSLSKFTKIFLKLEDARLLDIHIVNNKIHEAKVTDKGLEVLKNPEYSQWSDELEE